MRDRVALLNGRVPAEAGGSLAAAPIGERLSGEVRKPLHGGDETWETGGGVTQALDCTQSELKQPWIWSDHQNGGQTPGGNQAGGVRSGRAYSASENIDYDRGKLQLNRSILSGISMKPQLGSERGLNHRR